MKKGSFVFLIIFFTIFFLISRFGLFRVLDPISIHLTWIIPALITISIPLATMVDKRYHSPLTIVLYTASVTIMGFLFILFCLTVIAEVFNLFYPLFDYAMTNVVLLALSVCISIGGVILAHSPHVRTLTLDGFGKHLRLVQLSDVHIGTIHNKSYLKKVITMVKSCKPDIVVITGDLFDGSGKLTPTLIKPLQSLTMPVFMVMGNHEYYEGYDQIAALLAHTNVKLLRNEAQLCRNVRFIGLEYDTRGREVTRIKDLVKKDKKPAILLQHVPIGFELAKKHGIRLMLSGHTHYGQVFPFSLLVRLVYKHDKGLFESKGTAHYVSPGTGTWGPPMRLGSRNEVTLFLLR